MDKLFIIILTLWVVVSCGGNEELSGTLDRAEKLMQDAPDSALVLLRGIDRNSIGKRAMIARHALLHSQALDKNAIDLVNDSIIKPAVAYYSTHGSAHEKALMYFYRGRIFDNARMTMEAMDAFLDAEYWCKKSPDSNLLGLIYSYKGSLFSLQHDFENALKMYILAKQENTKTNNLRNKMNACGDISRICLLMRNYDDAVIQNKEAERLALKLNDSVDAYIYAVNTVNIYFTQYNDARRALDSLENACAIYNQGVYRVEDYVLLASIYCSLGDLDRAKDYITKYKKLIPKLPTDSRLSGFYFICSWIEEKSNNLTQSFYYYKLASNISDSLLIAEKQNYFQELDKKYNQDKLIIKNEGLEKSRKYVVIIFGLTLIIGVYIVLKLLVYVKKRVAKKKDLEILEYKNFLEDLKVEYHKLSNDKSNLTLSSSYYEKNIALWEDLLELANNYSGKKELFYDKFKSLIQEDKKTVLMLLRNVVNARHNGIINHLFTKHPSLSEDDLNLCALLILDVSNNALCFILDIQLSYLHNRQYQLRRRMELTTSKINIKTHIRNTIEELKNC